MIQRDENPVLASTDLEQYFIAGAVEVLISHRHHIVTGQLQQFDSAALLAATALDHDLYLATRNVRDVRDSGATVFNPWEDDPTAFPVIPKQRRRRPPGA